MIWVHAFGISAKMIQLQPRRDWANKPFVPHPMSRAHSPMLAYLWIPRLCEICRPFPTQRHWIHFELGTKLLDVHALSIQQTSPCHGACSGLQIRGSQRHRDRLVEVDGLVAVAPAHGVEGHIAEFALPDGAALLREQVDVCEATGQAVPLAAPEFAVTSSASHASPPAGSNLRQGQSGERQ